jgi:transposase
MVAGAGKRHALRRAGLLNPKAAQVRSPLFKRIAFFDAEDKLQVKYEMLRCHEVDRIAISEAASLFGYTRQGFYQIQRGFREAGMAGLLGKKRGRKGPLKCTPAVVTFLARQKQAEPELSGRELSERLLEQHGIELHRRTIEKMVSALPRRKKKPSDSS